jgi:xanthine dehydrogenase accessory factor
LLDFRIIVSDDRAELCTSEQIPGEVEFLPIPMEEIPSHLDINEQVYIVGVTRGSDVDILGLPTILEYTPAYIGMIGSLKRWGTTKKALLERGVPRERIELIKSPIALILKLKHPTKLRSVFWLKLSRLEIDNFYLQEDPMWKNYHMPETVEQVSTC